MCRVFSYIKFFFLFNRKIKNFGTEVANKPIKKKHKYEKLLTPVTFSVIIPSCQQQI